MRTGLTPTRRAIVVMGKLPRPGRVKTRLAAELGAERAAELYEAFLRDVLDMVEAEGQVLSAEAIFSCQLHDDEPLALAEALCPPGVRATRQGQGDLGDRMEAARLESGARHVVIIGSDAPTMPRERIYEAFCAIDGTHHAVVGPTTDGGYDLIGLAGPGTPLFVGMPWSTPAVLEQTRLRAVEHDLDLYELSPSYDLDEVEDLPRALEDAADGRAPRTRAALRSLLSDASSS